MPRAKPTRPRLGVTLVKRVCCFCNGAQGLRLWPWSGRAFLTTHTVCRRCAERRGVLERAHVREPSALRA